MSTSTHRILHQRARFVSALGTEELLDALESIQVRLTCPPVPPRVFAGLNHLSWQLDQHQTSEASCSASEPLPGRYHLDCRHPIPGATHVFVSWHHTITGRFLTAWNTLLTRGNVWNKIIEARSDGRIGIYTSLCAIYRHVSCVSFSWRKAGK